MSIDWNKLTTKLMIGAAWALLGFSLGYGLAACAEVKTTYIYDYKENAENCGSGGCGFTIYKNGSSIFYDITQGKPILYTKQGMKTIDAPYKTNEKLKFVLFQRQEECVQEGAMNNEPLYKCDSIPVFYSPNVYSKKK